MGFNGSVLPDEEDGNSDVLCFFADDHLNQQRSLLYRQHRVGRRNRSYNNYFLHTFYRVAFLNPHVLRVDTHCLDTSKTPMKACCMSQLHMTGPGSCTQLQNLDYTSRLPNKLSVDCQYNRDLQLGKSLVVR